MSDLEDVLDRLYALPPEEFVAARDAAAKELEGEARALVKALRRPTVAAALANRLVREQPDLLDELLAAGERLRAAQLEGSGELRNAVAEERAAVDAMVKAAARMEGASPVSLDRVRGILRAAAGDDAVRAALEAGRIEREATGGGAWPAIAVAPAPSPPRRREPRPRDADAARKLDERREAEAERTRLLEEAVERRRQRARAVEAAERAAAQAHKRLERAQGETEAARSRLADAEQAEAEAREDAQRTLRALNEAQALRGQSDDDVRALEA